MDPQCSAQDVLLCDLCKTDPLQSHCELCHKNFCISCVGKHLSDSSKKHNVVSYKHKKSTPNYPECPDHAKKHCELYCEKCDIPVCSTCVSSGKHKGHDLSDILKNISSKTQGLQKDLEELEIRVYPKYEEIVSDIQTEKARLDTDYKKLAITADQHGEVWHREIDTIVSQRKSDIEEMKNKHMAILNKNIDEITQSITEIKQIILDLKTILSNNDVSQVSTYKSRNTAEFQRLPPKVLVTLPSFSPQKMKTDLLHQSFGSLSSLSITTEEQVYTTETLEAGSTFPVKPLLDEPRLTAIIDTGYTPLCSVTCLNDEEIWTCGANKFMKLHNLQGKLVKPIQAKSGNMPGDIAVTLSGDLVYTDPETRTVNIVKNKKIQTVIRLEAWEPRQVCNTSFGDLLVTMVSDDYKQSKVARYSGSTETQSIQFDDQGQPLYSSNRYTKYLSENRNLDICVADYKAKAVVVVNQSGKLRFRYTGHPSTKEPFKPAGITTDSQSQILTADYDNDRIHILDKDGHFLRYIDKCGLYGPWGLCVDTRDNLFVTDDDNEVKKFQYL
ncbi:tripartite motif-containing protein 2-like [Ostrea edulis]|uniref:tripartite motif-containing protein 2-like n=1 Tax=Ostrea edulis TaxID=37623 RepID=UPI0024AFF66C|nr:tripartite motif-containing protein 2-like [Ostrea edulis]